MRKNAFWLLAVLMVVTCLTACDGDQVMDHSKAVLATSKATWQDIQDEVAKLYVAGKITDAQWGQFVTLDAKYRSSHNAAVQALKVYEQVRDKPAEQAVFSALAELDGIIAAAVDLVRAFKGGA